MKPPNPVWLAEATRRGLIEATPVQTLASVRDVPGFPLEDVHLVKGSDEHVALDAASGMFRLQRREENLILDLVSGRLRPKRQPLLHWLAENAGLPGDADD